MNGEYRGNDKIGELMHDFNCKDPKDIKNKVLRERVRYYKEDEKGVKAMCDVMNKIVKEEVKERYEEIVINMLKNNEPVEKIASYLGYSVSQIQKIRQKVLVEA